MKKYRKQVPYFNLIYYLILHELPKKQNNNSENSKKENTIIY